MTVPAVHAWATNGHLVEDVSRIYDFNSTLDATYGRGRFWTRYRPAQLVTNDLNPDTDAEFHYDFRDLPWGRDFDTVVFDPPYKLNGTPSLGDFDSRYGISAPTRWQDRMSLILEGVVECGRVCRNLLLVKVQDQVVSGRVVWQTLEVVDRLDGWRLVDRFDLLGGSRPQPMDGRRQRHGHGRPSSLLVFERSR